MNYDSPRIYKMKLGWRIFIGFFAPILFVLFVYVGSLPFIDHSDEIWVYFLLGIIGYPFAAFILSIFPGIMCL